MSGRGEGPLEVVADAFNEACNRFAKLAGELSGGSTAMMKAITGEVAERAAVAHRCTILSVIEANQRAAAAEDKATSPNGDTASRAST